MSTILEVRDVWKEYNRMAQKEKYLSLRDQIAGGLWKRKKKQPFWALQGIDFNALHGESVAIVGKNGSGKSTLLKVLSRITPPTKGNITLRGRLASLLEVGTGFHPELTGRENIFFNGSILGLNRVDILKQFDAIVDFSDVEAFLDTPLKHYSSGMQLRLAFAVAAHLEPEILVIDEVLAVGDSSFQKKCIDKMTEVSRSGRTILFVSHNMQAVKNLCSRGILLNSGQIMQDGPIDQVIDSYLETGLEGISDKELRCADLARSVSSGMLAFDKVISNAWVHKPDDELYFDITLKTMAAERFRDLHFGLAFKDNTGVYVYHISNLFTDQAFPEHKDSNTYRFELDKSRLKPGIYTMSLFVQSGEVSHDWIPEAARIEVTQGNVYGFNNSEIILGRVQPSFKCSVH